MPPLIAGVGVVIGDIAGVADTVVSALGATYGAVVGSTLATVLVSPGKELIVSGILEEPKGVNGK